LRVRTPPLETSGLAMRKFADAESLLVASPKLLDRLGRPKHPSELANLPTISMTAPGDKYTWHFRERDCTPINVVHVPRLMTDGFEALRAAALAGVGIAYVPQLVVQDRVLAGELERVLPEFGLQPGIFHAVFPSRRGMVPAVRALIDALARELAQVPVVV